MLLGLFRCSADVLCSTLVFFRQVMGEHNLHVVVGVLSWLSWFSQASGGHAGKVWKRL